MKIIQRHHRKYIFRRLREDCEKDSRRKFKEWRGLYDFLSKSDRNIAIIYFPSGCLIGYILFRTRLVYLSFFLKNNQTRKKGAMLETLHLNQEKISILKAFVKSTSNFLYTFARQICITWALIRLKLATTERCIFSRTKIQSY